MSKRLFPLLLGLSVLAFVGCDDDDDDGTTGPDTQAETFVADLTGDEEVPPVQTDASGTATFTVQGSTVDFTIDVTEIEDAVAAHIHSGEAGVNGAVLVPLFESGASPFSGSGELVSGMFDAGDVVGDSVSYDQIVDRLGDGTLYANVHTLANPPGEIRGQIAGPVSE